MSTVQTGNDLLATGQVNYLNANELFLVNEMLTLGVDSIATAPPGSPADYNSRLIQGTGTGDFAGKNNNLAIYFDGSWLFAAPITNMVIWVKSLRCYYRYTGSAWEEKSTWVTLTDGTSISVNAANGENYQVTIAGNRTLANPTNLTGTGLNNDGRIFRFRVSQDATGSRTLAYGSKYKFPGATPPTLSTGASAVDLLEFIYHRSSDTLMYRGSQLNIS